ncbi:nuclear transport factor 2 family protein [Tamaricihabitans halophyticus]|uniref:nuclear transport factor 2 family protein n=1 Tax=Tamaricihabitans halophyticus TaxID=1262583 RepID=UPI00140453F8|nr:nuclear transport factor 2 family protein [Tamaricihabitans halophyticus]
MLDATTRTELLDLYGRYAQAIDANDGDRWIECWLPEATFVPGVGAATAGRPIVGHAQLRSFAERRPDDYPRARILTTNHTFEQASDHIAGRCYGLVVDVGGDRPELAAHVVYHDEIVRYEGRWCFRARRPEADVEHRRRS